MQRYAALGDRLARGRFQAEHMIVGAPGRNIVSGRYPVDFCPIEQVPARTGPRWDRPARDSAAHQDQHLVADIEVLHQFDAPDQDSARAYYNRLCRDGCPPGDVVGDAGAAAKAYRFKGDYHYIHRFQAEFGAAHIIKKQVEADPRFVQITGLLNQIMDTYRRASRFSGVPQLLPRQKEQVAEVVARAEKELDKLVVITAGAAAAIDEAIDAMGLPPSRRTYTTPRLKPERPDLTAAEADAVADERDRLRSRLADRDAEFARLVARADAEAGRPTQDPEADTAPIPEPETTTPSRNRPPSRRS